MTRTVGRTRDLLSMGAGVSESAVRRALKPATPVSADQATNK